MDTSQWPQGIGFVRAVENSRPTDHHHQIKKPIIRPQKEINCPRCNSTNTKFCYYNNYSLSQPRYFCKTCRRYWTEGGNLRNVPVGGGSRKNKRPSSSSSSKKVNIPNNLMMGPPSNFSPHDQNPNGQQTLNIPHPPIFQEFGDLQFKNLNPQNPNLPFSNFNQIPVYNIPNSVFSSSSSFSVLDGLEKGYNGNFPFEDQLKEVSTSDHHQFVQELKGQGDHSNVGYNYWNGMINGGSW